MVINRSVFNQFQHVHAFWRRFRIDFYRKILKKDFYKMAEIFKMAAPIFQLFVFQISCNVYQEKI
jgi:hypothetical protein